MKLLLITQDFPPCYSGGIAAYYHNLCHHLGGAVEVLTTGCDATAPFDAGCSFRIHRRPIPTQALLAQRMRMSRSKQLLRPIAVFCAQILLFIWHAMALIRRTGYDWVFMGHLHLTPAGVLLRRLTGCRYGVIVHGGELEHYWHITAVRKVLLWALNHADLIIANSDFTRQQYYRRGVRRTQHIHVLHPGVDAAKFSCGLPQDAESRNDRSGTLVLLTVGRLEERKGHATVLQALARVDRKFPTWEYRIAGTGSELEKLVQLADDLQISHKVHFLGFVPDADLPDCYAHADIFVMPSRALAGVDGIEGFGIVYLEAAAGGVPTVAGRSGGVEEAVLDGVTGILVDPEDVDCVANALLLLMTDADLRAHLGRAAKNRVVQELDWRHQAASFKRAVETCTP